MPPRFWFAVGLLAAGCLYLLARTALPAEEPYPYGPPPGVPWQYCQETPEGGVGNCGPWHSEPYPGRARR
jgi:hypothetical protein